MAWATPTVKIVYPTTAYAVITPDMDAIRLSAYAFTDSLGMNQITSLTFEVEGESLQGSLKDSTYYAYWTPPSAGTYTMNVSATDASGESSESSMEFEVTTSASNLNVRTLDAALISVSTSRTYKNTYQLPTGVNAYKKLTGYLSIVCPPDCDPWDRLARIQVRQAGGKWVEIIRYITAYGNSCDHQIDLSDYLSLLQGEVEIQMFIDTWTGGWEVSLDLDYEAGTPEYKYQEINVLWDGSYPFGDISNLTPTDVFNLSFSPTAEAAKLKMFTSGHGWGENNSLNAAEFYDAHNKLHINDDIYDLHIWMNCNPNPDQCQPQGGSWEFDRAGWCPGAIGKQFEFNLTEYIGADNLEMKYLFANYVDFCHPNHPSCVSPFTCPDCNDGFNPHYWVASNLVSYSNVPPDNNAVTGTNDVIQEDLAISVRPNPSNGQFQVALKEAYSKASIHIYSMTGQLVYSTKLLDTYNGYEQTIDLSAYPSGLYSLKLETDKGFSVQKIAIK